MEAAESKFQLWLHKPSQELYIVNPETGETAGPVPRHQAFRMFRKANSRVPDGCDLAPSTWGFDHLKPKPMPFPEQEWSAFETSWLDPSVTLHRWAQAGQHQVSCTSWEDANPNVKWLSALPEGTPTEQLQASLAAAEFKTPIAECRVGRLAKSWGGHPRGALFLASSLSGETFAVIEFPA